VLELVPKAPNYIMHRSYGLAVLLHHVVKLTDVNAMCADIAKSGELGLSRLGDVRRCRRITTHSAVPVLEE